MNSNAVHLSPDCQSLEPFWRQVGIGRLGICSTAGPTYYSGLTCSLHQFPKRRVQGGSNRHPSGSHGSLCRDYRNQSGRMSRSDTQNRSAGRTKVYDAGHDEGRALLGKDLTGRFQIGARRMRVVIGQNSNRISPCCRPGQFKRANLPGADRLGKPQNREITADLAQTFGSVPVLRMQNRLLNRSFGLSLPTIQTSFKLDRPWIYSLPCTRIEQAMCRCQNQVGSNQRSRTHIAPRDVQPSYGLPSGHYPGASIRLFSLGASAVAQR